MKTNKTTVTEANKPQCSVGVLCSEAAPEPSSPTVAHSNGERESHTSAWLARRKKNTVKVHVQGHSDKGRGLVPCTQRTMFATTASLFADWLQVRLGRKCTFDQTHEELNVTLSLFILWKHSGKHTKKCVCHRASH